MTVVVNMRRANFDIRIDRQTILGNPFIIGDAGTRDDVINKYRVYARERMMRDKEFRDAILACDGKVLGCWCRPAACHGDVIVELIEELKRL